MLNWYTAPASRAKASWPTAPTIRVLPSRAALPVKQFENEGSDAVSISPGRPTTLPESPPPSL
jgi:hypothetical protein